MSKEHKKYIMQEQLKEDRKQYRFTTKGILEEPIVKTDMIDGEKLNLGKVVYCPFCLFKGKLRQFLTSCKTGISKYKAKCPECEITMLMKTVNGMCYMNDTKIRQYAEWCFMYRLSGFWQKVDIKVFNYRLKKYGWSITFWTKYRSLKGSIEKEDYDE